jgi:predicted RNA-binding Zn-ribbon protein involved in translation (DUF1610 family)
MESKVRTTPVVGLLAILCVAAVLLPGGCQSSGQRIESQVSDTCPICERQTRINPITRLKYTTCVCPTCGKVYDLDDQTLDAIERFTGPNIGDRVHVCDSCGKIIEDCAACRQKSR